MPKLGKSKISFENNDLKSPGEIMQQMIPKANKFTQKQMIKMRI